MPAARRARPGFVWVALGLAAVLVSLLLLDNRAYLFHARLYETGDWASNSLFVREAKRGWLLHGHYSRWAFYHPGPALLATMAAGEALFYNLLRVVPTPMNGQMIALCMALGTFFSFALAVFARRLGPHRGGHAFFLPLALLFATWHFAAMNGAEAFLETWPACPPIVVFLCLLVAAASTASGGGSELPLLVVAAGWLVHNHVAQPLFVVPLTLLAYGGLLAACRRPPLAPAAGRRGIGGVLGAGWRTFPKAHVAAVVLLGLFILPLFLDALHGSESNLHRILAHLREAHEPPKKLVRSFCYFLTFGTYGPYRPGTAYFGSYSARGMLTFVALHWEIYLGWITALTLAPVLYFTTRRSVAATGAVDEAGVPSEPRTFIPWFYGVLAAAFVLTLIWGMKQDGQMFYFNAFFNYSIFFGLALGLAGGLAVFLHLLTRAPGLAGARRLIVVVLWLGVAASVAANAPFFRLHDADSPGDRAAAQSTARAAAATLPPGALCFLRCEPWDGWPEMVGVALQLERLGYQARVDDGSEIMFGLRHTISHDPADLARPLVRWEIVPIASNPALVGHWPLQGGYGIKVLQPQDLNPANGRIIFAGQGNFGDYAIFGWSPTAADWTYSDEHSALLDFHPLALPPGTHADVVMTIDAWAFDPPDKQDSRHVEMQFNGKPLGTFEIKPFRGEVQPLRIRIPAADWEAAAQQGDGRILCRFPDAISPKDVGMSTDDRPLGGAFRDIRFSLAQDPSP